MKRSVVTIGNFDGVHLGHQAILEEVIKISKAKKLRSVAITFHPHPAEVLGYSMPKLLSSPEKRREMILSMGVGEVNIEPFTSTLAALHAAEFVKTQLIDRFSLSHLVIGPNTHIGRAREGTPEKLLEISKDLGFDLTLADPVYVEEIMVSSSRIRNELSLGDVKKASQLLSRNHRNEATIVKGDGRGKKIGFPTLNLQIDSKMLLPKPGVYATWFWNSSEKIPSVTNIGVRPTFYNDGDLTIETHLLDWKGGVLTDAFQIEWVDRLRDEKKFLSKEDLTHQIRTDCLSAKSLLS